MLFEKGIYRKTRSMLDSRLGPSSLSLQCPVFQPVFSFSNSRNLALKPGVPFNRGHQQPYSAGCPEQQVRSSLPNDCKCVSSFAPPPPP